MSSSDAPKPVCGNRLSMFCATGSEYARTPTAAIIDAQSVRAADTVPAGSRGWDNGKKVGGRIRHIATDTVGLLLAVVATAASTQDRGGAVPLLARLRERFSTITLTWADASYAGRLVRWADQVLDLAVTIVKRPKPGFVVLPAPLGRGTNAGLDQQTPPVRPRLRNPTRPPRSHGLHRHHHDHVTPTHPKVTELLGHRLTTRAPSR
jgi:hypothetical protein